jgi:kynurenine/2-aminoadipate aminotransferase
MDVDGRVLRFDSFSKIISAGARLGWVTGPNELVQRIVLHGMASNLHPSGLGQICLSSLLKQWGIQGFQKHTKQVSEFYKRKRNVFIKAAEKYLKGLAEWTVPSAGDFF